jgi:hypothetical protein
MNYLKVFIVVVFAIYFSVDVYGQTVRPIENTKDDVKVYYSKMDLYNKVKANIERKQNLNTEGRNEASAIGLHKGKNTKPKNALSEKIIMAKKSDQEN